MGERRMMKAGNRTWPRASVTSRVTAVILMVLLVMGQSAAVTAQEATPTSGGRLVFATNQEPTCFDPQISAGDITAAVTRTVVDSLVAQLPDGQLVPWLATDWEVSDDLTQFTFNLETGITFSDGTPFNAEAVKYNFDRI